MPPIRRYLRITKYSVLECRIYLDNPADASRWLLNERSPVLPRVIEAVRPLVLPKLREENARAKSGKKKKGWKDTVVEDDFEVSVFLTETSSRHSILRKEKSVKGEGRERLGTTGGKMMAAGTEGAPVDVAEEEDDGGDTVRMADIPAASDSSVPAVPKEESREGLVISDSEAEDEDGEDVRVGEKRKKNGKDVAVRRDSADGQDDKKKMALETTYDGFSIYGRILCLVVKRRGGGAKATAAGSSGTGQAMIEEWIASTQAEGGMLDD